MNKNLFELLNAVKLVDVVVTSALFIVIISILITQRKKLKEVFEVWRKKKNFEENAMLMIKANTEKIKEVENTMLSARQTSVDIRAKMYNDLNEVVSDVKTIIVTLTELQEREAETKRAEIKHSIEKAYRECCDTKVCTDTQFETLKDLIQAYEKHGGTNSFVHTLVIPEMYTWELIKKIPEKEDDK